MTPKRRNEISGTIGNLLDAMEAYQRGPDRIEQMLIDSFEDFLKIEILIDSWREKSEGYSVRNTTWDDAADSLQDVLRN